MRYIDMPLEDAMEKKWEEGLKRYRCITESKFVGDPVDELFQELLDCMHYVAVIEAKGADLPGYKTIFRNMALALQKDFRR